MSGAVTTICFSCHAAPATTTWGFPVCQDCSDSLDSLHAELQQMEKDDPVLGAIAERIDDVEAYMRGEPSTFGIRLRSLARMAEARKRWRSEVEGSC